VYCPEILYGARFLKKAEAKTYVEIIYFYSIKQHQYHKKLQGAIEFYARIHF
jgi:hypothetical protein